MINIALTVCSRTARYANTLLTTLNNRALIKHREQRPTAQPSRSDFEGHALDFYAQGTGDESRQRHAPGHFTSIIGMVDLDRPMALDVFGKDSRKSAGSAAIESSFDGS